MLEFIFDVGKFWWGVIVMVFVVIGVVLVGMLIICGLFDIKIVCCIDGGDFV